MNIESFSEAETEKRDSPLKTLLYVIAGLFGLAILLCKLCTSILRLYIHLTINFY